MDEKLNKTSFLFNKMLIMDKVLITFFCQNSKNKVETACPSSALLHLTYHCYSFFAVSSEGGPVLTHGRIHVHKTPAVQCRNSNRDRNRNRNRNRNRKSGSNGSRNSEEIARGGSRGDDGQVKSR